MAAPRLLLGTYTEKLPHVDGKAAGILSAGYEHDALAGTETAATVRNPSWLVVSKDGANVYTVVETVDFEGAPGGGAAAYARDVTSGELTFLNAVPSGGVEPAHIEIDPSGRYVLEANYRTGSVAVFAIREDGGLGEMVEHVQFEGSSIHPRRQTNPHAHQVVFDPTDPARVIIPDLGTDTVRFFDFGEDGSLTEQTGLAIRTLPGAGPRHIAFHPDGDHLFLLNELDNTLLAFRRDGEGFAQIASASTLPEGHTGHSQGAAIRVSPSGKHVLTSNRGFDSIAVFDFDAAAGTVSLAHLEPTRGKEPRDFVFTPDGRQVLVANQDSDTVLSFAFDESTAGLRYLTTSPALTPVCLVFV